MDKIERKNVILTVVASIACALVLNFLLGVEPYCSYAKNINALQADIEEITDYSRFLYEIEVSGTVINPADKVIKNDVDSLDYFENIKISGYEAQLIKDEYKPDIESIVLSDENNTYDIGIYKVLRPDLIFFDGKTSLKYGFFGYIPRKSIPIGIYRIGLKIRSDNKDKVLWTGNTIIVH